MPFFKEELKQVKAFAFDVDGVLSSSVQNLSTDGNPIRTTNIKDGFAIVHALKMQYPIVIISGGYTEEVRLRYEKLGIKDIYLGVKDKVECLTDFLNLYGLKAENILFMGDDLPDYGVMKKVGVPVCPNDAVPEIRKLSKYISDRNGGEGCVRDVIEQVLRAHNHWIGQEGTSLAAF